MLLQHNGNLTSDMITSCSFCEEKIRGALFVTVDLTLKTGCLINFEYIIRRMYEHIGRIIWTIQSFMMVPSERLLDGIKRDRPSGGHRG